MLVLKILCIIFIIFGLFIFINLYNDFCKRKFNHELLKFKYINFIIWSSVIFSVGFFWYVTKNSDKLNGILIMLIGLVMIMWRFIDNYKKTNLMHGSICTVLQILFTPIALIKAFIRFFDIPNKSANIKVNNKNYHVEVR